MRQATREQRYGAVLAARLRTRREEIGAAVLTRVLAVSPPPDRTARDYVEGLRRAVDAALEQSIDSIEQGTQANPRAPEALLTQARLAARSGVGLDTVLRRYVAGHALLGDFTVEEAEREVAIGPAELKRTLRCLAMVIDLLIAAVSAAYTEEAERLRAGAARHRGELIERLLDGELADPAGLSYDFEAHHLGLIARGPGAVEALTRLARSLDARMLVLERPEQLVWAWLGQLDPLEPEAIARIARSDWPRGAMLAIGEAGDGRGGWRLTHRQAAAALLAAERGSHPITRYREVALLAAALQDDLLAASLRHLYLRPLATERDGGAALRETLRAYFAAERNVSSAAASLGLTRKTVNSRIRAAESRLGRPLGECAPELELALRFSSWTSGEP